MTDRLSGAPRTTFIFLSGVRSTIWWAGWAKSMGAGPRVPGKKIKLISPVTMGETVERFADFGL